MPSSGCRLPFKPSHLLLPPLPPTYHPPLPRTLLSSPLPQCNAHAPPSIRCPTHPALAPIPATPPPPPPAPVCPSPAPPASPTARTLPAAPSLLPFDSSVQDLAPSCPPHSLAASAPAATRSSTKDLATEESAMRALGLGAPPSFLDINSCGGRGGGGQAGQREGWTKEKNGGQSGQQAALRCEAFPSRLQLSTWTAPPGTLHPRSRAWRGHALPTCSRRCLPTLPARMSRRPPLYLHALL